MGDDHLFLPSSASSIAQMLGDNLMKIFFAVALISAVLIPATKIYAEESGLNQSDTAESVAEIIDISMMPAKLRNDEYSLANAIEFPRSSKGDVSLSIACNAPVTRQGALWQRGELWVSPSPEHNSYCISGSDESWPYEKKVIEALRRAKMVPAQVYGKKVAVSIKFTVIFKRTDDREEIYVVPNWYLNNSEFGLNYYAPQVVQNSILKNSSPRCLSGDLLLRTVVDDKGLITSIAHHGGKVSKKCLGRAFHWVESWEFIPGKVNGVSTQMPFLITVSRRADFGV